MPTFATRPWQRVMRVLAVVLVIGAIAALLWPKSNQVAYAADVSGIVYRDFNANGSRQTRETGIGGVTVTAYGLDNAVLASTTTSSLNATRGRYTLTGLPSGQEIRVEFTGLPSTYLSGPHGANSLTTVQFITAPTTTADLALNKPQEYCQSNPELLTTCFVYGPANSNTRAAVVSFPYTAGTTSQSANTGVEVPTTHTIMRPTLDVGSVWGVAYQRESRQAFVSAFMKRHVAYGPNGTGAIYKIDTTNNTASFFTSIPAGPNLHNTGDYFNDNGDIGWNAVGKTSLGDIDISENGTSLWAINLFDRRLYRLDIGNPPTAPASPVSFALPDPGTGATGCPLDASTPAGEYNRNLRPGAVKAANDRIYVGVVCTAESTQNIAHLRAFVFAFNPTSSTWDSAAVNIPLNYPRGCSARNSGANICIPAAWQPWSPTIRFHPQIPYGQQRGYAQPWLIDLEFDETGAMILGLSDRLGHQTGNNNINVGPVEGVAAGDILRLAPNDAWTSWTLENNGSSGGTTTSGAGNNQGPGGGEFYFHDRYQVLQAVGTHDELSLGGMTMVLGNDSIVEAAFDSPPAGGAAGSGSQSFRSGGIIWLSNTTGQRTRSYMLYAFDEPLTFGKASGIGDIEPFCGLAPLEIGNRIWLDLDNDGLQDPGEFPLAGIIVEIYNSSGVLIGTATTDANGNYYFNASNVPGGIQPGTTYEIRIPLNQPNLNGLIPTTVNGGSTTPATDSNGVNQGAYVNASITTGGPGANNHTIDFGFNLSNPTSIELVSFSATPANEAVNLSWRTGVEQDTAGFHLMRATSDDRATATQITTQPIPARGSNSMYSWVDRDVQPGMTYYYWLVEVETGGTTNEFGPYSVIMPGAANRPQIFIPVLR